MNDFCPIVFESSRVLYKCPAGHESLLNVQNEAPVCYECKLDAALQKLADIRHAWEHSEEIGRVDTYAGNTIKEALKP